jgi:hypothetical protein
LYDFINKDKQNKIIDKKEGIKEDDKEITPYENDIEYLDDRFQLLSTLMKIRNAEMEKKEEENERYFKFK